VFAVLADGWLFAVWVVGASRIRDVDPTWPRPGAEIHHSVGAWPLLLDDTTTVVESQPDRMMHLRARAWPAGEADVLITIDPTPSGCRVTIVEDAAKGPAVLIPQPITDVMLNWRNTETLRRLGYIAEGQREASLVIPERPTVQSVGRDTARSVRQLDEDLPKRLDVDPNRDDVKG